MKGIIIMTKKAGKDIGTKTIRVPRKRKKELKRRWDWLWSDFIVVKFK